MGISPSSVVRLGTPKGITTSANSTVTCLYSADRVTGVIGVPHLLQNLAGGAAVPHDPHDSPVAVSPARPSPLASTSVSFHRCSAMSVISPCHIRDEALRRHMSSISRRRRVLLGPGRFGCRRRSLSRRAQSTSVAAQFLTIQAVSRKCPIGHALDISFENWTSRFENLRVPRTWKGVLFVGKDFRTWCCAGDEGVALRRRPCGGWLQTTTCCVG